MSVVVSQYISLNVYKLYINIKINNYTYRKLTKLLEIRSVEPNTEDSSDSTRPHITSKLSIDEEEDIFKL